MSFIWQAWSSVAAGKGVPGTPVTAVSWGDSAALFLTDPNGGVYAIKASPGFGWQAVPGLTAKPGAPVTALASGGGFVLFVADASGEIFTTSGTPYESWQPWTSVSEGSSVPGATVAAVPWEDSFALFISDPNGGVYAIKATPGFGWEGIPGLTTLPGAPITAFASGSGFVLFVADASGEIFTTTGTPYQSWQPWTTVSQGSSRPGAPVAAVPWEGSFALFIADPNGGVYAIKAIPGFGWEEVPGIATLPGAPVTALSVGDHFVLFMVDATGKILSTSGVPYQGWDPWTDSQSVTVAGQLVTALVQPAEDFDVFIADSTGNILQASVIEVVQQMVANFSFADMIIINTRSVFTDTDYVTISVAVGDADPISKTMAMGSLSPGNYPVGLSIQADMPETPPTAVSFAWSVVNKGDADEADLQKGVEKALSALVKTSVTTLAKDISQPIGAALGAAIGAAIGTAAISLTGSAIAALAGYVLSQVVGIVFADCDGTITTGLRVYTNTQILGGTMSGDDVIRDIVLDQGMDSPTGCGSNSEYQTTTTITSFPRIVPAFDINGHYTVNGQPGPVIATSGNSVSIDMSFSGRPNATGTILNSNGAQFVFTDDKSVPNGTYTVQIDPPSTLFFVENKSAWTKSLDLTAPVSITIPVIHRVPTATFIAPDTPATPADRGKSHPH
jgi:hypothetical protein